MPPLNTTMWTYPWDLHDEGYEWVLQKLKSEVGLDAINLASAYHTFDMVRPHLPSNNTLQVSRAAIYFQPRESLYGAIKPHVSPLMQNDNWWGKTVTAAASVGLDLNSWTVFFHNSYQAQQHPECAEVRCTGDISTSALCPANPDVRAFAIGLSRDLVENYGITLLECESLAYSGWGHIHHHAKHGINLGAGGHYLFSLCFCDICKNRAMEADIDVAQLQQAVTQKIQTVFKTGHPIDETPKELNESVSGLRAFSDMREVVVTSLVRELKDAINIPLSYILMGDPQITGANPKTIAQIADSVEILSYTSDPQRTHARVSELLPTLQNPNQLVVGLQAYPPASPNAETLCANLRAAREQGVNKFAFYNYGIMPIVALDWVRQAIHSA